MSLHLSTDTGTERWKEKDEGRSRNKRKKKARTEETNKREVDDDEMKEKIFSPPSGVIAAAVQNFDTPFKTSP